MPGHKCGCGGPLAKLSSMWAAALLSPYLEASKASPGDDYNVFM